MIVRVSLEYEIDVDGLDEEFVDIEEFAKEEAKRMFEEDYVCGDICDCMDYEIIY
jgi:hypothetical protein